MIFDNSYFLPEVRDGFYISSKMKRTWAATLEVYKTVEEMCRKHNIKIFAAYGTLLGAVRHGGFIPWDDDFDLFMIRDDYMRFIELADKELPGEYACLSLYRNSVYEQLLLRVVNREEFTYGNKYMDEFHGFPYNAGIDIFPLDYINDDEEAEKARQDLAKALKYHIEQYGPEEMLLTTNKSEILEFANGLGYEIVEGKPIRQQLYIMLDGILSYFNSIPCKNLGVVANIIRYNNKPISKSFFENTLRIPFENTEVYVPLLYDQMLVTIYNDYMRCVRNWDTHEYPVYLGIEEGVHQAGLIHIWKDYTYEIAKDTTSVQLAELGNVSVSRHRTVVFMPYMAEHWKWMEPLWLQMYENENITTFVIPIPYYIKNNVGELEEFHYEGNMLPEYVPITEFDQYDLVANHPDKIVIQNIYDQYDTSISIPPFFYTERIKNFTDCITCVPDFVLDEFGSQDGRAMFNMRFFCTSPGVINAKEVFVQSENMRERYIDKLMEFAGIETKTLWEKKIKVVTWELEKDEGMGIFEEDIPEAWWPKLLKHDGSGKKVLIYYTCISCLAQYKERYISKIKSVFELLSNSSEEISAIWLTDNNISLLTGQYSSVRKQFEKLRKEYNELPYIIVAGSELHPAALAISDAFYGDRGVLMHEFERNRRPIMIQNVEII